MNKNLQYSQKRGFFYALYSRIFIKEADQKLLETIERNGLDDCFPNFSKWDVRDNLSKSKLIKERLDADFAEISLLNLIPYESFYIREDGMIQSGGENPVIKFYEEFDYMVDKEKARIVSPDHIGAELEFMYMLCEGELKALKNCDENAATKIKEIQKSFLQKHILKWVPLYLINVKNEAQTPFYHDAAMTGLEFVLSDYEYLNE